MSDQTDLIQGRSINGHVVERRDHERAVAGDDLSAAECSSHATRAVGHAPGARVVRAPPAAVAEIA